MVDLFWKIGRSAALFNERYHISRDEGETMKLDEACWLATAAYGAHILEETALDWRGWVRSVAKTDVDAGTFFVANALVLLVGVAGAEVASAWPVVALGYFALMLINATFFHVAGFIRGKGRFSPGLLTAVLLFYPAGIWGYSVADHAGLLTRANLIGSILLGALMMATPVLLIRARALRFIKPAE
ncbi:MAG: HXXEE domain-containing protein [Terracidiphilus sp.]